jgi:alcohol dehydrogenase class IV
LLNRSPDHPALERYGEIGRILSGDPEASPEDGVLWVESFCSYANIQPLSMYGLTEAQFPKIIEKAVKASSMKGNPITLTEAELRNILQIAL